MLYNKPIGIYLIANIFLRLTNPDRPPRKTPTTSKEHANQNRFSLHTSNIPPDLKH